MKNQLVRIGVAGLGAMGLAHARTVASDKTGRLQLAAVATSSQKKASEFPEIAYFSTPGEMISSGAIDAAVIATPHLDHVKTGCLALNKGLHVMVEKPLAATVQQARMLVEAHRLPDQVFAIMLNMRTRPVLQKIREIVQQGLLGTVRRVSWTATMFFRPEIYYGASPWRGTWRGEGGGVLLNQAPHHLDLLQWIVGMPSTVRGFCKFGRYHDIEVEDDVTAYLEWAGGATGTFVTSTGEAPGTTRIEIAGDLGRLTFENDVISFFRNDVSMSSYSKAATDPMGKPKTGKVVVEAALHAGNYGTMFRNFADAIFDGAQLIAPACEGLKSLELANAILLSSLEERTVELPLDENAFMMHMKDRLRYI